MFVEKVQDFFFIRSCELSRMPEKGRKGPNHAAGRLVEPLSESSEGYEWTDSGSKDSVGPS